MAGKGKKPEGALGEGDTNDAPKTIRENLEQQEAARVHLLEQTDAYVTSLAKKAAGQWYEENRFRIGNPESWGVSFYTAAAAILVASFLMVAEFADQDASFLREMAHKTLGTDAQVNLALKADTFSDAVLNSIRDYVDGNNTDNDNPLSELVRRTMKSAPTLVFHGQATFGDIKIIPATNSACTTFFEIYNIPLESAQLDVDQPSSEFDNLPSAVEEDGIDISAICEPSFVMDLQQDVDIPFHARFFGTGRSPGHEVYVILHVYRQERSDDRKPIDSNEMLRNLNHGFCILYSPGKRWNQQRGAEDDSIELNSFFEHQGEGLFLAKLSDVLKATGGDQAPSFQRTRETLHSIALVGVSPAMIASFNDTAEERAEREACADVEHNIDQVITVRAMVLVNLAPDDR